jgi:hypothetical protein
MGTRQYRSRADGRARRILGCLTAAALGTLLVPTVALSATTAQIVPSFAGGKPGTATAIRFQFTVTESAGGIPQAPVRATIHLPKGTGLGLARLPKAVLCSYDILTTVGRSACPKGSHAGPVGSARLEAVVGGRPTIVKAPIYPFVIGLHGGGRALALLLEAPAPFPTDVMSLVPTTSGLILSLLTDEVSPGNRTAIIGLSLTLGGNAGITMPKSCPRGGFVWRTDFSYWEGPSTIAQATSPCPGKGKATTTIAQATSTPKTAFQCEKRFKQVQSRQRCFSQLPGASCAHPLEAQKAGNTTRGEHRYFKLAFHEEAQKEGTPQYGTEQYYSYAPSMKNVAICPHGVVYKVSLLYVTLPNGETRTREHDTKTIIEPTTAGGGHFHYYMTAVPIKSWYLVVKGYYIHPPWEHGG